MPLDSGFSRLRHISKEDLKASLLGKIFGKLTVLRKASVKGRGKVKWLCRCKCGREKAVLGGSLINKRVTSCGQLDCMNNLSK